MTTEIAQANIGQPFKYGSVYKWDTIQSVTASGYIIGDFLEAPAEDCRLKLPQPEALKVHNEKKHAPRLFIIAIVMALATVSCCRPATDFQVHKWERRHKFESPGGFWGLHIFQKKNTIKY
jgi:hypothetical protein